MTVYFVLILLLGIGYFWAEINSADTLSVNKKGYFIYATILLTFIMGLKKFTVGADWVQYLYVYNKLIPSLTWEEIMTSDRAGFYALAKLFQRQGVGDQGYIFLIGLILSVGFGYFFYRYSNNLFLTFYLHITIGMFTMSMSGIRQSIAVIIVLMAYILIEKRHCILSLFLIFLATSFHASAIVFLVVYLCRKIQINFKKGILLWGVVASSLFYRAWLTPVIEFFTPAEYLSRIELLSDKYPINPMLILIALTIPLTCLVCQNFLGEELNAKEETVFSNFYVLSCISAFCTIMSLNSNLLGRVGFYFQSFSMVLIANTVYKIMKREERIIAYVVAFVLPMIQFVMSTPGGTLVIDNYRFFWQ